MPHLHRHGSSSAVKQCLLIGLSLETPVSRTAGPSPVAVELLPLIATAFGVLQLCSRVTSMTPFDNDIIGARHFGEQRVYICWTP